MTIYIDGWSAFCFVMAFFITLHVIYLLSNSLGYYKGYKKGYSDMRDLALSFLDSGKADAPIYSNGEQIWPKDSQK